MSGYWAAVDRVVRGLPADAAPRRPEPFEGLDGGAGAIEEEALEGAPPAAASAPAAPRADAPPPAAAGTPAEAPKGRPDARREPRTEPAPAPPPAPLQSAPAPAAPAEALPAGTGAAERVERVERVERTVRTERVEQVERHHHHHPAAVEGEAVGATPEAPAQSTPAILIAAASAPPETDVRAVEATPAPPAAAPPALPPSAPPAEQPVTIVRIDRIEIRLEPEAPPSPAPRAARRPEPVVSLDAYLAGRGGRA